MPIIKLEKEPFFISDTHFSHKNIIGFCSRPFNSIIEHDEVLISNWNDVITEDDIIIHTGDFSLKIGQEKIHTIINRLNGIIYFIPGNHDKISNLEGTKVNIMPVRQEFLYHKTVIVCDHFPLETWWKRDRGSVHIHGHVHNDASGTKKLNRFNVSVEVINYKPIKFSKLTGVIE